MRTHSRDGERVRGATGRVGHGSGTGEPPEGVAVRPAGGALFVFPGLAAALLALLVAIPALHGQEPADPGGWLPWAGCWEAVSQTPEAPGAVTCVRPADAPMAAEILTVEDEGELPEPELLRADGRQTAASREGCEGWERAEFSGDGSRVYLRTEYTCEGGVERRSSGIFSLVSPWEWLDVRAVEAGDEVRIWTRRYRRLEPAEVERPELRAWAEVEAGLSVEAARLARSGAPSLDDVVEASSRVHEDAVVAWLAEEGDPMEVDADDLVELADAGVPGAVTDMVVALGNPDYFVVGADGAVEAEDPLAPGGAYRGRRPTRVLTAWGGRWGGWGYPRGAGFGWYGYRYDPFYHPWGYAGYGWGYGYTYRPTVVYVRPRTSGDSGGRMVPGRGYVPAGSSSGTRSARPRSPAGAPARSGATTRAPSRGDRGGSVSPSGGYRGGSSGSTGRTARPRGDGGDN